MIKRRVRPETAYEIAILRIMELEKENILLASVIKELEAEIQKLQNNQIEE